MKQSGNTEVDLSRFKTGNYNPGASFLKRGLWHLLNYCLLNSFIPGSHWRSVLLSLFGANIGQGVVVKPHIRVKYPWFLNVGKNVWIGEDVWIDNLGIVDIGNNVCLSQGAMLMCGSHNYKRKYFDLMVGNIKIEDGAWIGARAIVTGGVTCGTHSVLAVNSVASKDLEPYTIYRGNPAEKVRERIIEE